MNAKIKQLAISPEQKVEIILTKLDELAPHMANPSSLANLMGVAPSTISRWRTGEVRPRGKAETSLDLLYRTVLKAASGNEEARGLLQRLAAPALITSGILGLGFVGILIAMGLDWLLRDDE